MKITLSDHAIDRLLQRNLPDPREAELIPISGAIKKKMKRTMTPVYYRKTMKQGPVFYLNRDDFYAVYIFRKLSDTCIMLITAYWLDE